eukprot:3025944-Pyramimonas_sp.AAC.1
MRGEHVVSDARRTGAPRCAVLKRAGSRGCSEESDHELQKAEPLNAVPFTCRGVARPRQSAIQ